MVRTTVWFNRTFNHVRGALELVRAGDSQGRFATLCTHPNPFFTGFLSADQCEIERPVVDSQSYVDYCLELGERRRVGVFFPGHNVVAIMARAAEFKAKGIRLISVAKPDVLLALADKALFYDAHANDAISGPDSICVRTHDEYVAACRELKHRYPTLAIKPCLGVYGIGFRVIDYRRSALHHMLKGIEYHVAAADLERELKDAGQFQPILVMEYLPGREYSVDCLAVHGDLQVAIARRKEKGGRGGQVIVDLPEIQEVCQRLAKQYGLNSIFNVQFREDLVGRLRLLEVNARMSGGIAMACLAGPNLPHLAVQAAIGELDPKAIPATRYGLRVGEYLQAAILA